MAWLNLFRSASTNAPQRSHLQNLISMAKADGYYDQIEKEYLLQVAKNYGISAKTPEELEKNASKVAMASTNDERAYKQLYELVGMMLADGVIHNSEIELCVKFAEEMGIAQSNGSVFIGKLVKAIEKGASEADFKKLFV
ncbi:MAG: hypothetical protein SFU27_14625 [Thermonemataceae bacterium]|nr:hypothetical protein [Thermonemataceae bacterium]